MGGIRTPGSTERFSPNDFTYENGHRKTSLNIAGCYAWPAFIVNLADHIGSAHSLSSIRRQIALSASFVQRKLAIANKRWKSAGRGTRRRCSHATVNSAWTPRVK